MTISQKRKLLKEIQRVEKELSTLKRVRMEVAETGYASASLGSSGGSKSYTMVDMAKITELISHLNKELYDLRTMLVNDSSNTLDMRKKILTVYC